MVYVNELTGFFFVFFFNFLFSIVTDNERQLADKYTQALHGACIEDSEPDDLAPFTYKDLARIDLKTGEVQHDQYFQINKYTKSPWDEDSDSDEENDQQSKKPRKRSKN